MIARYFARAFASTSWISSFFPFERGGDKRYIDIGMIALSAGSKGGYTFASLNNCTQKVYNIYVRIELATLPSGRSSFRGCNLDIHGANIVATGLLY
jgi:hypothetical protein